MNKDEFPTVSKELMEALDGLYPEKCPSLDMTDKQIWFESGKRSVVNFLIDIWKAQNENILQRNI